MRSLSSTGSDDVSTPQSFDLVNRHILTSNEMSIALATAEYAGFNRQKTRRKCYTGRSVEPSCAQMAL